MRGEARAGSLVLVVAAACGFDTSGAASASFGMSLGEGGHEVSDGSEHGTGDGSEIADSGSTAGNVDGSGSTGAPQQCESCGAAAPQGWQGPFAIAISNPPDPDHACAQGWTEHAYAWRELHADPATCGCSCAPAGGMCNVTASYFGDAACTDMNASGSSSGDCKDMYTGQAHGYVSVTGTASGTSCTPVPTTMVPPPTWTEGALLCAPPQGDACDGGTCLPATPPGFDARWCITADGEQACPDATYSQPLIVHRNVTDSRTCSTCTCSVQGTPTCPGHIDEFYQPFCLIPGPDIAVGGGCQESGVDGMDGWSFSYDGTPPSYGCGGSGSVAMGDALAADPMTICCTAP